jgi:putative ABC transport system ATP-binding protein
VTFLLSGRAIAKSYGPTPALRGVDIDVAEGEIVAVTGLSGCGKSTLLHCLAGILRVDGGTVTYRDQDLGLWSEARRSELRRTDFGVLFQFGQLVPELTAAENVALPLLLAGRDERSAMEAALRALHRLGLAGLPNKLPDEISGGQAQRVAVARALVGDPVLVLADEPTGQLDHPNASAVVDLLLETAGRTGAALVVATHDPAVSGRLAERWEMRDGELSIQARDEAVVR